MPESEASSNRWYRIKAAGPQNAAELLIYGDIGESWWEESVTALDLVRELQALDVADITVRINSYGGSVTDGLAIYNALRRHPATVTVEIDGIAASIASLIAMAGDIISMAENARLMIHAPWTYAAGNSATLRDVADQLDGWAESMASSYARSGKDTAEIIDLLTSGEDYWYSAQEAQEQGFVDNITEALAVAAKYRDNRYTKPRKAAAAAQPHQEQIMPEVQKPAAQDSTANIEQIRDDATKAARAAMAARNQTLTTIRAVSTNPKVVACINECLADVEITLEEAQAKIREAGKTQDAEPLNVQPAAQIAEGGDSMDKFRTGARAALSMRMGAESDDRANPYRGQSLAQLAATALGMRGVNTSGMTRAEIADKVFAAHSTSDFPLLLADSANKVLQDAYMGFGSTWGQWCDTSEVSDFKANSRIRLGSFNNLATKLEGGEYKAGTVDEERETIQAATKGRFIQLTREMLVNDDLGGFTRMARMLGTAAARTVNADVYTTLTSNPTMSDGTVLFHADHSNLAGSGGAISVATLGAGRAAMRKQKMGDDYLGIRPAYVIVPVALEDTARQVIASESDVSKSNSRAANPIRNFAEVISDPYLDANSATAWYLAASAMEAPLIEVAFLDGQQTPYVASEEEFLSDAIRWKVRLDYGVAANDYRGGYKNAGA